LDVVKGFMPKFKGQVASLEHVKTKKIHRVKKPNIAPVNIKVLRPNLVKRAITGITTTQLVPKRINVPTFASKPI
jgi:hypothetical protein